jgi:hypothetical protein
MEVVLQMSDLPSFRRQARNPAWEFVLMGAFSGLLVLAAAFTWSPPGRVVGAGVLLAFTILVAGMTPILVGSTIGALAWVFYLGFAIHGDATLSRPETADIAVLLALITTGAVASSAKRWQRHRQRKGWPAEKQTVLILLEPLSPPAAVILDLTSTLTTHRQPASPTLSESSATRTVPMISARHSDNATHPSEPQSSPSQ